MEETVREGQTSMINEKPPKKNSKRLAQDEKLTTPEEKKNICNIPNRERATLMGMVDNGMDASGSRLWFDKIFEDGLLATRVIHLSHSDNKGLHIY